MVRKTVFTESFFDFEIVSENNQKVNELQQRINNAQDDRSKIIFCGIIVEYYLDRILKCFFLDFKELSDRPDFTFSFKISLLKSMQFIPNEIIQMCDIVRRIRNEFAHNFDIDNINQLKPKLINTLNQIYLNQTKNKDSNIELFTKFKLVFNLGHSYLRTYEKNVKLLREKIDEPSFESELKRINENRMHKFHKDSQKQGPLKVIDRGNGEIEEVYPHSFSVIKNKK